MALSNEEHQAIDGQFKEIIDSIETLTKEEIKTKVISLRSKLKREEKDVGTKSE